MPKIREAIEDFRPDFRLVDERGPTKERARFAANDIHFDDKHRRYFRDTTIERALTRKVITAGQYTAANKFYLHWYRAGLSENLGSIDLTRIFSSDPGMMVGMAKTESQAFHRQQYRCATQKIGVKGSLVVEAVVCRDKTLEQVGYQLGWQHKMQAIAAATESLREKLDLLCSEWGIDS